MKTVYKILLTLNSTSLMLFVYLVLKKYWIFNLGIYSIFIYILGLLIYTKICIAMRFILKKASIEDGIKEISVATDEYISVFLGYFFVTLSVPEQNCIIFGVVFALVNIFIFNSQTIYFNPLFCLFGYNFYEVHTALGTKVYVITKEKNIKGTSKLAFPNLRKINEFTYIDEEKKK